MCKVRGKLASTLVRLAAAALMAAALLHGWGQYRLVAAHDTHARENVELVLALGGSALVAVAGLVIGWGSAVVVHLLRMEWQRYPSMRMLEQAHTPPVSGVPSEGETR